MQPALIASIMDHDRTHDQLRSITLLLHFHPTRANPCPLRIADSTLLVSRGLLARVASGLRAVHHFRD